MPEKLILQICMVFFATFMTGLWAWTDNKFALIYVVLCLSLLIIVANQ